MRTRLRSTTLVLTLLALATGALGNGKCGKTHFVKDGESIQAAVDAAQPGDRILVGPGTYTAPAGANAVVTVLKDDITLIGHKDAVIEAAGHRYGISVGNRGAGCLQETVSNFTLRGFTIQNADNSGAFLANVVGYELTGGIYLDNEEYGPYPVCSIDGLIAFNYGAGHNDAAIYVGQSDTAEIKYNLMEDNVLGIEVENTANTVVFGNTVRNNTTGILVVVLPGLNIPATDDVLIQWNNVIDNNRANTGSGFLDLLPSGLGILNVGGDGVVILENAIRDNKSGGVASIGNPFALLDPRIEPFVDGLEVRDNVIKGNGLDPDPASLFPGADIIFGPDVADPGTGAVLIPDPDPTDNCFAGNRFDTEIPAGITSLLVCP